MKKILLFLAILAAVTGNAGTWKVHSYYVTSKIQNVYDTGDKIYYLNSGSLFQFDKATTKTIALTRQNMLSDNQISQIFFDWQNQLLFVAYANCNIDIIDNAGTVYNISKLKDMVVDVRNYTLSNNELASYTGKTINDITFNGGLAYVAVDYGYVTIDEATKTIVANNVLMGNTGNVNSVAVIGNTMVILSNSHCYYGPVGTANPISSFPSYSGSFKGARIYPINGTSLFIMNSKGLKSYDFTSGSPAVTNLVSLGGDVASTVTVQKAKTGFLANFTGQSYYYKINETGTTATKASSTLGFATMSRSQASRTSDLASERRLISKTRATAFSLVASQPMPHTVSVG